MEIKKRKFIIRACEWANTYRGHNYNEVVKIFEQELNEVIKEAIFEEKHSIDSEDFKQWMICCDVSDISGIETSIQELYEIYLKEVSNNKHKQ